MGETTARVEGLNVLMAWLPEMAMAWPFRSCDQLATIQCLFALATAGSAIAAICLRSVHEHARCTGFCGPVPSCRYSPQFVATHDLNSPLTVTLPVCAHHSLRLAGPRYMHTTSPPTLLRSRHMYTTSPLCRISMLLATAAQFLLAVTLAAATACDL